MSCIHIAINTNLSHVYGAQSDICRGTDDFIFICVIECVQGLSSGNLLPDLHFLQGRTVFIFFGAEAGKLLLLPELGYHLRSRPLHGTIYFARATSLLPYLVQTSLLDEVMRRNYLISMVVPLEVPSVLVFVQSADQNKMTKTTNRSFMDLEFHQYD